MRLINADELLHILNLNKNEMSPKACEVIDLVIDIVNQRPTVEAAKPVENVDIFVERVKKALEGKLIILSPHGLTYAMGYNDGLRKARIVLIEELERTK